MVLKVGFRGISLESEMEFWDGVGDGGTAVMVGRVIEPSGLRVMLSNL